MPGNTSVCGACVADLEHALGNVSFFAEQLDVALARQARIGSGGGGRRSAERPLPFDQRASGVAADLRNTLVGWVRVLAEQAPQPLHGPACFPACLHGSCRAVRNTRRKARMPDDNPTSMAAWLMLYLGEIRRHEAASDIVAEITHAVRAAERCVDRPADHWYAGPCGGELAPGAECAYDLYALPGAAEVRCRGCGTRYDVAERRAWLLAEAEDQLANVATLCRALARLGTLVQPDTVYQWASRGRLVAHGVDARGRPTYRVGDVLELVARMPAERAS